MAKRITLGDNLFLHVGAKGGGSYTARFMWQGRQREVGLGSAAAMTLAEARAKAAAVAAQAAAGTDPMSPPTAGLTLGEVVHAYAAAHGRRWGEAHRRDWLMRFDRHAEAVSELPIGAVNAAALRPVLEGVAAAHADTARRLAWQLGRVMTWAAACGYVPAAVGFGGIVPAGRRAIGHAALPYGQVPALWGALLRRGSPVALAVAWCLVTACRRGEAAGMTWGEVAGELWTVPAERMKARREQRVPLSSVAMGILPERAGGRALVWQGATLRGMTWLVPRLRPGYTLHGLRASFRTWAAEQTQAPLRRDRGVFSA